MRKRSERIKLLINFICHFEDGAAQWLPLHEKNQESALYDNDASRTQLQERKPVNS